MIIEYTFKDNAFAEVSGSSIKFWENTGLPNYEGSLDGFMLEYTHYMQELINNKVVRFKLK